MWLLWLIVGLALLAAFSAGLALGLRLLAPARSKRSRMLLAGGLAGFLPMSVAFAAFLFEAADELGQGGQEFALGLLALVVLQLVLWAVVTLPAAWYVTERLAGEDSAALYESEGAPAAIEG